MYGMFYGANKFNKAIGKWNTAKVTSMSSMFLGASAFDQKLCWPHNSTLPFQVEHVDRQQGRRVGHGHARRLQVTSGAVLAHVAVSTRSMWTGSKVGGWAAS
jgi:surface protein